MPVALVLLMGCPVAPVDDDDAQPGPIPPTAVISLAEVRAEVGEPVSLSGATSINAVQFTWSFGDGAGSDPSASPQVTHAWDRPGHYLVALTVENEIGYPDSTTIRATISWPRAEARPTRASVVDIDYDGDSVIVLASDFDAVAVVRPSEGAVSRWYATCARPTSLSHSRSQGSANTLLVACPEVDEIQVWDTANHALRDTLTLPWGSRPWSVVAPSRGTSGWIALQGTGEVVEVIVPATGAITLGRRLLAVPDPRGLALHGDVLLVSRHRSDDGEGTFARIDTDAATLTVSPLAFDPGPDSDTTSRGVPSYLQQITITPDGRRAWLPGLQSNVARGLFRDGRAMTHETTNRAIVSRVALTAAEVAFSKLDAVGDELTRRVFDDRDLATSVAFSPAGDWAYVGHLGMEAIDVLDAWTLQASGGAQGVTGGVQGLVASADGRALYSASTVSRRLTAFAIDGGTNPELTATWSLVPDGSADPLTDAEYEGRLIFQRSADVRMTQDGYLSCASCHLDGETDRRTWDFTDRGEGLRNTITLLGHAGTAHGPLHWSANFDEVQDFENDIRGPQRGAGLLDDADWAVSAETLGAPKAGRSAALDALAAWVTSLDSHPRSPWRALDGQLTEEAVRGQALFEDPAVGCADCHPAPDYTDSAWLAPSQPLLHDVGTLHAGSGGRMGDVLIGLDTPSLRGAHATAPYLHDGSAATLREVLTSSNPDDLHGVTSHLSAGELGDLERFLLELE